MTTQQTPPLAADLVRVTYPNPLFRPIPSFSIEVPEDWVINEFADALFVMGPVAGAPGYWSNVVVRHERMFPDATLEHVAAYTWQNLQALYPDAVLKEERLLQLDYVHYIREVELTLEGSDEVVSRLDSFVFGPVVGQPTVDLFQFTWLNPAAAGEDIHRLYVKMLESLRFEDDHSAIEEPDPSAPAPSAG